MNMLHVSTTIVGNTAGFIAKHAFIYHGFEAVRLQLQNLVSKVAVNHFGSFVGSLVGRELSSIIAMPVTCLLGEIVHSAMKETIQAVVFIAASFFGYVKEKSERPVLREMLLKIASFAANFFAKNYFCSFCMPLVKCGLELCLRHLVVVPFAIVPAGLVTTPLAILMAPTLTFLLGDIIGHIASEVTYHALAHVYTHI